MVVLKLAGDLDNALREEALAPAFSCIEFEHLVLSNIAIFALTWFFCD